MKMEDVQPEKEEEEVEEEDEMEEEDISQDPILMIAFNKYLLSLEDKDLPAVTPKSEILKRMMTQITENNMAPYYNMLAEEGKVKKDTKLYNKMKAVNDAELKRLDESAVDAKEQAGDTEVREAKLAKADYLKNIGEKEACIAAYDETLKITLGTGEKIDIMFSKMRVAFAHNDQLLLKAELATTKDMVEKGGDWERRNLCGVYEAAYMLLTRDFAQAAKLFNKAVATFTCYPLMSYNVFVFYTVLTSVMTLDRVTLKKDVIGNSELLAVINDIPHLFNLLQSLYTCKYKEFYQSLACITTHLKRDPYLGAHTGYFLREVRLVAYSQFLESYRSVTMENMAEAFGVSVEFIDRELSRFISSGRLNSKIDRVNGVVETNRPNKKCAQYNDVITQGDVLLNRIQRLTKVINF